MNIKDIVKGNVARFSFYRAGHAFYEVEVEGTRYKFPVDLKDLGTATLLAEHKAITLMRYIRKALEDCEGQVEQGFGQLSCPTDLVISRRGLLSSDRQRCLAPSIGAGRTGNLVNDNEMSN